MNMIPVSSTNISAIGYEGTTLYVRFHQGSVYAYFNVPRHVYEGLMSASSHGSYLANYVKNVYQYQRIS